MLSWHSCGCIYASVDYLAANAMHWFKVQMLKTPEKWAPAEIPVVFAVTEGHPGAQPYGFFVPQELNMEGKPPSEHDASHPPPFEGKWRFLLVATERMARDRRCALGFESMGLGADIHEPPAGRGLIG